MKNTLLMIVALSIMTVSCKKEEEAPAFTPTDVTGTTTMKGNVSKNIIIPNGNGGWTSNGRIPAKGVKVSVKVNKNSLYPNSSAQGADVYEALSDTNGNYSLNVRSNANGVAAQITIEGFTATLDTLINGKYKKGLLANYTGTSFNNTLYMGQGINYNYAFTGTTVQSNPNTINTGTAIITGSVGLSIVKEIQTGTLVSLTNAYLPLVNHKVYLNINKDPLSQQQKVYEVSTDASGFFQFTVATVDQGTSGFSQNVNLWITDYAATRDTLKLNNTLKTGKPGVYSMHSINISGVYSNDLVNGNYLHYTTFTPN